MTDSAFRIDDLSPEERLDLMERLWESLRATGDSILLSSWQREELDRRLDQVDRGEVRGIPWQEVQDGIRRSRD